MRIAWISTPLTASGGYGKVTREVCLRLADRGYEVINIGGRGTSIVLGEKFYVNTPKGNSILVLPAWGNVGDPPTINYYVQRYKIDAIISLNDAYMFTFGKPKVPFAAYCPIDTHLTKKWCNYLLNADYIVSPSKFGYNELLKHFPDFMVKYIPHGCDTSVFRERSEEEKLEIRRRWKMPEDSFVMLSVAANWGERKCLPQIMLTFKRFLEKHTNAYLYLYTKLKESPPTGYDLMGFAEELGIEKNVMGPAFNPVLDSIDDEQLAELYSASDVYVNSSMGEGFCLPILEAMSCGVPVIGTNFSSIPELLDDHGWLVDTVPTDVWVDCPIWVPLLCRFPIPNLNSLLECMEDAYNNPDKRKEFGRKSREHALNYDWEKIMPKWDELIKEMVEGV
jgi:glycosyltransferase involved in cell wall biosynthesis